MKLISVIRAAAVNIVSSTWQRSVKVEISLYLVDLVVREFRVKYSYAETVAEIK